MADRSDSPARSVLTADRRRSLGMIGSAATAGGIAGCMGGPSGGASATETDAGMESSTTGG